MSFVDLTVRGTLVILQRNERSLLWHYFTNPRAWIVPKVTKVGEASDHFGFRAYLGHQTPAARLESWPKLGHLLSPPLMTLNKPRGRGKVNKLEQKRS